MFRLVGNEVSILEGYLFRLVGMRDLYRKAVCLGL